MLFIFDFMDHIYPFFTFFGPLRPRSICKFYFMDLIYTFLFWSLDHIYAFQFLFLDYIYALIFAFMDHIYASSFFLNFLHHFFVFRFWFFGQHTCFSFMDNIYAFDFWTSTCMLFICDFWTIYMLLSFELLVFSLYTYFIN